MYLLVHVGSPFGFCLSEFFCFYCLFPLFPGGELFIASSGQLLSRSW